MPSISQGSVAGNGSRPTALPVLEENIPAELKQRPCWVVWNYVAETDPETGEVHWNKPPFDIRTRMRASSTKAATWCTFPEALESRRREDVPGIGTVLNGDGIVGADLDDVRDPVSGIIKPEALEIVRKLNSYTEVSPSACGLRILFKAKLPPRGRKRGWFEVYETGRYVTITGHHVEGTPATIEARQAEIDEIHARIFADAHRDDRHARGGPRPSMNLDDMEIIRRACQMRGGAGARFSRLWSGDISGYTSASEADLSLCNYLSFWCGPDRERIADLFSQSGLCRSKWQREDYRQRTIERALLGRTAYYTPGANGEHRMDAAEIVTETIPWPAPLADEAFYGLAGEIVRAIRPHTEADDAALLFQLLVGFGTALGHTAHFVVEGMMHYLNEYLVLAGLTAKGRKGTAWGWILKMLGYADPHFIENRLLSGLSSGEGLIYHVRDPIIKRTPIKQNGIVTGYRDEEEDDGVSDKRLLAFEGEFASVLKRMNAQTNTLSAVLRLAWETGNLGTLTKNSPLRATGAHIGVIAHSTIPELLKHLTETEQASGLGNRFLMVCVKRSKVLPRGSSLSRSFFETAGRRLGDALAFGYRVGELFRDETAERIWAEVYEPLSEGKPGLTGTMIARGEAHVMRLAALHAVLDKSSWIKVEHLGAALAAWKYVEASARYLWGDALGDRLADELLGFIKAGGVAGVTRTEIRDYLKRNQSADVVGRALGLLLELKLVLREKEEGRGRDVERWFATGRPQ
jgi:hypothetical protein